ncbi:hypothetical protein ACSQ67_026260 [Phaseolus vulgaris]
MGRLKTFFVLGLACLARPLFYLSFEAYVLLLYLCCLDPDTKPVLVINNKLAIHHVQNLILRVQLVLAATCSVSYSFITDIVMLG